MKKVKMPGFTAEKSVFQARGNYTMATGAALAISDIVVPEQFGPLSTYLPGYWRECLSKCKSLQDVRNELLDECIKRLINAGDPPLVAEYQCREGLYRTCRLGCFEVKLSGNPLTLRP